VGAEARDHVLEVVELVRVGLPGVVLRLPGRVDHDRVERERVAAVALEVVLHVALVLVDVARLPVSVGPLGQQRGEAVAEPQEAAQARRRRGVGEHVQPERARRRSGGDRHAVAEVELHAVAAGFDPERVAAAREQPGDGRVVALRDAAHVEHVGRAVGTGVAPVGPEADAPAGLVELLAVARPEASEALAGTGLPLGAEPKAAGRRGQLDRDALVVNLDLHVAGIRRPRPLQLLRGDHALGELDELVARLAGCRPEPHAADQAAPAPDLDGQRVALDRHPQGPPLQNGHAGLLSRLGRRPVAIR
jgi:hypothetical protein